MGKSNKVMVAMSGGVDSSACALLLLERGWEVAGATFRLWPDDGAPVRDAAEVCGALGIPHHVFDFSDLFRTQVVAPFAEAYRNGRTPNPCVFCNRHIKFPAFRDRARALGYDAISTGHYASVTEEGGRFRLRRAANKKKDQSYVLYTLTPDMLPHIVLPLGGMTKEEVRATAGRAGLSVQSKADSQDICFVPDGDYPHFLEEELGMAFTPGDFVDPAGRVLGRHRGIALYTVGQRKGLGLSLGKPAFVAAIDAAANTVTVDGDASLWRRTLTADRVNWIEAPEPGRPFATAVKIRYAQEARPAQAVYGADGVLRVTFDAPVRAITPGQSAVLYDGDYVMGGGTIL